MAYSLSAGTRNQWLILLYNPDRCVTVIADASSSLAARDGEGDGRFVKPGNVHPRMFRGENSIITLYLWYR